MLNPELDMPSSGSDLKQAKKKQKLVKHKRKNWKKTDISEVEQGIEELRQEQLLGGVRAEKKDEELFFINKKKLDINEEGEIVQPKKKSKLSIQEKLNSLNCYRNLTPDVHSAPAHVVSQKKAPSQDSKRQLRKLNSEAKKYKSILEKKKSVDKENLQSIDIDIARYNKLKAKKEKDERLKTKFEATLKTDFNKDLWTSSDIPEINDTNEYYLRSTKKLGVKRPKNPLYTQSALPHVEAPHPGTSYNPDYDDHQDLLLKAHLAELKKLQDEQKLMRKLATHAKKISWAEIERIWLEEMSVKDLFDDTNKEDEEENLDESKQSSEMSISRKELQRRLDKEKYGRSKANDPKAKRLKKKLQEKIKQRQKENEKKIRIQQNEIYRIKSLKKEVDEKLKKEEENAQKKVEEEKLKNLYGQKRLSALKYEEPDLELKLSNEITGSLRTLKAEGNILRDRYKSLQKRNIIEPRERAKYYRKFWKKKFEKRNALEKTNLVFENQKKKK